MYSVLVLELVILVLEANRQYSHSKILKASTRYSYSKVEYSNPSLIFILISRESDHSAKRARLGVAGHLSTHQDGGIPLSALPNGTTSKFASLFSSLFNQC